MLGAVYLVFALIAFAGWILHHFYRSWDWLQGLCSQYLGDDFDPDYLALPNEFWGALLLGLAIALALEGLSKLKAARAATTS